MNVLARAATVRPWRRSNFKLQKLVNWSPTICAYCLNSRLRAVGVLDCVGSAGHFLLIFGCEIMITERGQQQKRVFLAKCIIDHVTYFENLVKLFLWSLDPPQHRHGRANRRFEQCAREAERKGCWGRRTSKSGVCLKANFRLIYSPELCAARLFSCQIYHTPLHRPTYRLSSLILLPSDLLS